MTTTRSFLFKVNDEKRGVFNMKKNTKETILMFAMPLLLLLFIGKVIVTLYAIYSEEKQEKIKLHKI